MNHLFFSIVFCLIQISTSNPPLPVSSIPIDLEQEGNFDAFVMAKGIKADDIEALLSGNLKLDEARPGTGALERNRMLIFDEGPW